MAFPLLIFTDLDGSLLDHHTYSCDGAAEALQLLRQLSIPLILNSSKTRAEIIILQNQLNLHEAFISENGGGVFIPVNQTVPETVDYKLFNGYRGKLFGKPYEYIREIFSRYSSLYNIKGFGDMSVREIVLRTGLVEKDAVLAAQRDCSEPFIFVGEQNLRELHEKVDVHGLKITRGGRFYHLLAKDQDKGRAVRETVGLFQTGQKAKLITVGLGDAQNDIDMLNAVDIPVLIPHPDGKYEHMNIPGLRKASLPGSSGWGKIITEIVNEFAKG